MTYNSQALTSHQHSAPHRLGESLARWWNAYWMRRAQRSTVMLLHSLDDRGLRDIGIDRSEIESVVFGAPADRQLRYGRDWRK